MQIQLIIRQDKFARKNPYYHIIRANLPDNQWLGEKTDERLNVTFSIQYR